MSNYAEHPLDFWHWGDSADFVDLEQEEHWVRVVQSLEHGDPRAIRRACNYKEFADYTLEVHAPRALGPGDPSAILGFLLHQSGKPILPGLRKIIERLYAGEAFPRADGYLLRLEPPAFDRSRGRMPKDVGRPDRIRHAGMLAYDASPDGVDKDSAIKAAAKACDVRVDEARAAYYDWAARMSQE